MNARLAFLTGALVLTGALSLAAEDEAKSASDLTKKIKKALRANKEEEVLQLCTELAAVQGEEAMKALFELGLQNETPRIYGKITSLLAQRTDDGSLKFLEAEAKGSNEVRQVYVADIMAAMKHQRATEILGLMVEEKKVVVLRSAIDALARQKVKGSVPPLLKVLERLEAAKDRSQVYQEVRDALYEVTGQDYDALEDWKKWWDTAQAKFDPTKAKEGATQVQRPSRDKEKGVPEFGGKKIFGKNVVFVIDTSGTMRYVVKDDIPGLGSADGTDKGGRVQEPTEKASREDDRLAKFWTRIEMAKRALLKALAAFDAKARINILEFNSKVKKFEKTLFAANSAMKKKSGDWVRTMKCVEKPGTNTQDALEAAFAVDRAISEIYFLSDGLPSKDGEKLDPTEPILERVQTLNRFRKVKIHTFGYDPLSLKYGMENGSLVNANKFLKTLAESTGGSFTLLKVTDEKPPPDFKTVLSR